MYIVYVLKSGVDNRLYQGITSNLERRLKEHNNGKHKSTKAYVPWSLAYYEIVNNRGEARRREIYLKSGAGREFLKKMIF